MLSLHNFDIRGMPVLGNEQEITSSFSTLEKFKQCKD